MKDLESIVQGKSQNLRVIEDGKLSRDMLKLGSWAAADDPAVLRQKVLSGQSGTIPADGKAVTASA